MDIELDALVVRPYALTARRVSGLPVTPWPETLERLDALDPRNAPFSHLLNAANTAAYGELGMPLWVQVDCAMLPSAYHGFAAHRSDLAKGTWERLQSAARTCLPERTADALEAYDGFVPVSGFAAARTFTPDAIVAFSLYSLLPRLGLRSKCLGLLAHGAARQIGVAQYDNPVLRVHASIGPLRIVEPQLVTHSIPEKTFVYELAVPTADRLRHAVQSGTPPAPPTNDGREVSVDADTGQRIRELLEDGPVHIVAPGLVFEAGGPRLCVQTG